MRSVKNIDDVSTRTKAIISNVISKMVSEREMEVELPAAKCHEKTPRTFLYYVSICTCEYTVHAQDTVARILVASPVLGRARK